jgi:gamma-polyglutamate biosynthesis protein CapA
MNGRVLIPGAIAVLVGTVSLLCLPKVIEEEIFRYQIIEMMQGGEPPVPEPATLLFVGDIMLGRKVEWYMDTEGARYPFTNVTDFLQRPDLTIGNFEGIVSRLHIPTPSMTFRFSIRSEYLSYLQTLGFDVLSLANNHALDYGTSSLSFTRELCTSVSLLCIGTPKAIDAYSSEVIDVHGVEVGFLSIETIYGLPNDTEVRTELTRLASTSDTQVALVHWGNEYELTHSEEQRKFARILIDNGVDTVIGHHPHVIQDIELFKGKPIFYSLGNFIFDQYFITEVQEELAVTMKIRDTDIEYSLTPFTSTTTQSQPDFMTDVQKGNLFKRILPTVFSTTTIISRELGTITVPR